LTRKQTGGYYSTWKKRPADDLKSLSEAMVDTLKAMAEKGIDLNPENLLKILSLFIKASRLGLP
jgi:hypothetical protein